LTLWDKDQAPKSLIGNQVGDGSGSGQQCTYTANSVSCFGSAEDPLGPSDVSRGPSPTVAVTTTSVP
jgi:hypothetical protein